MCALGKHDVQRKYLSPYKKQLARLKGIRSCIEYLSTTRECWRDVWKGFGRQSRPTKDTKAEEQELGLEDLHAGGAAVG